MSNIFVTTLDLSLSSKLKEDLLSQGFHLTVPPYTVFSAQKPGISCTFYASGKLTVQGKHKEEFIAFYLEPEILQNLSFTYPEVGLDFTSRIGVDEAGKGDFFGPLCIAGVQADENGIKQLLAIGVKDSKKMTDLKICAMAKKIKEVAPHTVVSISPRKYNDLYESFKNLNHLLAWGHATVITELHQKTGCKTALIDKFGADSLVINALKKKECHLQLFQKTKGEDDPVVAAASILARERFVVDVQRLSEQFGIALPKGASSLVVSAAKLFAREKGKGALQDVAKLHFKTYAEVE